MESDKHFPEVCEEDKGKSDEDAAEKTDIHLKRPMQAGILPEYPKHGVIGSMEPMWSNLFYHPPSNSGSQEMNYRRQKFDFHEMYEKHVARGAGNVENTVGNPLPGLEYLRRGVKTSDVYEVDKSLPFRFQNPDTFEGYGSEKPQHPFFRTDTSEYGKFAPTVHDVPHVYHGLKNKFTKHLSSTGMPKNRSLNIKECCSLHMFLRFQAFL